MKSLEQLRTAYASNNNENRDNSNSNFGLYYPFWNIKNDESCKVRFLPDANDSNPFGFLVQKVMHNLVINGEKKSVPCLSMYEEDCPICKVSQEYYKVEGKDSVNGKKFWKKKQYLAQALVIEDPLPADPTTGVNHVGELRYLALGFQIYKIIEDSFKSADKLDAIPYAFEDGYDFIIKKTKQGDYSTYTTGTDFARKQRTLSPDELVVVGEKLADLSGLLPKHPGREKVEAMLAAALNGGVYQENAEGAAAASAASAAMREDNSDDIPWSATETPSPAPVAAAVVSTETPAVSGKTDIDKTLELIRARRQAAQK